MVLFLLIGILSFQARLPAHQPKHFECFLSDENQKLVEFKVLEILKSDTYNFKYIAQINKVGSFKTTGKVLLSLQKDSLNTPLNIDNSILVKTLIERAPYSKNPYQFEYKNYLKTLDVYHQTRIKASEILKISTTEKTIRGTAESAREFLIHKLSATPIPIRERAIIQALVLGQKRDIDKTQYQEFAAAGAIHILAVSGLHVGIIYFILLFITKPLQYINYGRVIQSLCIITSLWTYAYITGLSPSVCRAVTMFSFLGLATLSKRKTNTANTLLLSFIFLLVYNPMLIFHVGFQMSYMAVLAIIIIQPKLYNFYTPRNYFKRLFWGILTVTIAAQIGIMPLSLYYFHQFPGLFFISNLVILPFLSLILGGGILIILLAAVNFSWNWVYLSYGWIVRQLNNFIKWISQQDSFLFTDIFFSAEMLIASYFLLFNFILFWNKQSFKRITLILVSILMITGIFHWQNHKDLESELVIFHKSKNSLITIKEGNNLQVISTDSINLKHEYPLKSYIIERNITEIKYLKFQNIFTYKNQLYTIVDSTAVYCAKFQNAIVVLTQSPKVNLERLIDGLQPLQVIADGNNYQSYVERWKKTCLNKKIPFHSTYEKGAYNID
ncbi:competence protein ComEC [Patiriisocius marinus]|uniref:Competence protein ComEC n=2 Tax=Patiriisocius marinus TaxID=1397112 RepID=A0A5J4IX89_9FLAO|nr:competence protein ComEC [Patiriisocius marinus]